MIHDGSNHIGSLRTMLRIAIAIVAVVGARVAGAASAGDFGDDLEVEWLQKYERKDTPLPTLRPAAVAATLGASFPVVTGGGPLDVDEVTSSPKPPQGGSSLLAPVRSGGLASPRQASLPKADSPEPDALLRLLCKVSHAEAVIKLSGIVSEGRYGERDIVIEVNKHAGTISVFGVSDDRKSLHYAEAKISEYEISAAKVASKRGLTVFRGIVLKRLTGLVRITSERWRDVGEHVSFVDEYVGPCEAAASRKR